MNTVQNDYGAWTPAVGAEGSLARFKCEHPKMIKELLAEMSPQCDKEFNHKRRVTALADLLISYDIAPEVAVEKAEKFCTFMEIDLCPLKKSSPPSSW